MSYENSTESAEDSLPWGSSSSTGQAFDPENSSRSCYSYVPRGKRTITPDPEDSSWSKVSVRSQFDESMRSNKKPTAGLAAPGKITYFKDTIFVGGLPHNAQRNDVIKRFAKYGKIKKLVWPMLHDKKLNRKRPKGFAYVIYRNPRDAERVIEAHKAGGIYLAGFPESKLGIDRKRDNTKLTAQVRARRQELGLPDRNSMDSQRETATETGPNGKVYIKSMVFCGSIPHKATRDDIDELFSKFGKIKKIIWPQTLDKILGVRRHKGFAYVIFFNHEDSLNAVAVSKQRGGYLEIPNCPNSRMVVERKLDRPRDGEQGETGEISVSLSPPLTGSSEGERDFRDLYDCEKGKNEKLLQIVRDQRRRIQKLEQNAGRMAKISKILQGDDEDRTSSWRRSTPQASVTGIDKPAKGERTSKVGRSSPSGRSSEQPRGSPIPGRWSQLRDPSRAAPTSTQSMPFRKPASSVPVVNLPPRAKGSGTVDLRGARSTSMLKRTSRPVLPVRTKSRDRYAAFGTREVVQRSKSLDSRKDAAPAVSLLEMNFRRK